MNIELNHPPNFERLVLGCRERESECLTSPDPPENRHVREKAPLGKPLGFTPWPNEERIEENEKERGKRKRQKWRGRIILRKIPKTNVSNRS